MDLGHFNENTLHDRPLDILAGQRDDTTCLHQSLHDSLKHSWTFAVKLPVNHQLAIRPL